MRLEYLQQPVFTLIDMKVRLKFVCFSVSIWLDATRGACVRM
jgi:hypothetical protein